MSQSGAEVKGMKKAAVISELHAIINVRLFGSHPWLADYDIVVAINKKLDDLGLQETDVDSNSRSFLSVPSVSVEAA